MATNYTTKTAALKATTADIRKLTAKEVTTDKLFVDDASGTSTNVLDLITAAQQATTYKAGSNITIATDNTISVKSTDTYSSSGTTPVTGKAVADAIDNMSQAQKTANGLSYSQATDGKVTVSVAAATTSAVGTVQLSSATNSNVENLAATPKAVKTAYDAATAAQTALWGSGGSATSPTTGSVMGRVSALESGKLTYKVVHSVAGNGIGTSTATPTFKETSGGSSQNCVEYTIYLVPDTTIGAYVEYLCCKKDSKLTLEQIGTTSTDLKDYAKTSEVTTAISNATNAAVSSTDGSTTEHVTVTLGGTVGKPTVTVATSDIASASALSTLTTKVGTIPSGSSATTVVGYAKEVADAAKAAATLEAGSGINISNKTISVSPTHTYSATGETPVSGQAIAAAIGTLDSGNTSNGVTYSQTDGKGKVTVVTATTGQYGTTQLLTSTTSTAENLAATPKSVSDALALAKSDATSKANQALADAKTYADTAEADAISTAATTAQSKADAAQAAAKTYTDTAIAGITGTTGSLTTHTGNTDIHVTATQKNDWTTGAEKAGTAIQGVGSITGKKYIKATAKESTDHEITWTVDETALTNELAAKATTTALSDHTDDGDIHVTAAQKTSWDGAVEKANAAATKTALDALDTRVETAEGEIDTLQSAVTTLNGDATTTGSVKKAISDATTAITSAYKADDTTTLTSAKDYTDKAIAGITGTSGSLPALEGRVETLEDTVNDTTTGLASKASQTDLTALTGRVSTAEGNITTLTGDMTTAKGDIEALETLVGTTSVAQQITTEVNALKTGVIKTAQDTANAAQTAATTNATAITNLKKVSLTRTGENTTVATSTEAGPKVKVATTGNVGDGLTGLTVTLTDVASAKTLEDLSDTVTNHIADAAKIGIEIANPVSNTDRRPNVTSPSTGKIYLVPATTAEGEVGGTYVEWIYTNNAWVRIGTTATDLTDYAKTATVNTNIATAKSEAISSAKTYTDTREAAIKTAYEAYANQAEADAIASAKDYTDDEIVKVNSAASTLNTQVTANKNAIDKLNGSATTTGSVAKAVADATTAITSAYQSYADQAETDAKAYTNTKIAALAKESGSKGVTLKQENGLATLTVSPATTVTNTDTVVTAAAVKTYVDDAATKATLKAGSPANGLTVSVAATGTTVSMAVASDEQIGTVKLSDATTGTSDVDGGIAATPKAVKTALDNAKTYTNTEVKKVSDLVGTTSVATQIATEIAKLDATSSINSAGLTVSQTDGKVSASLTTATVETDGTITNGGNLVTANAAKTITTAAINALDVASHGNNGVKLEQTNGKVALTVSAGEVKSGNTSFVTGGAVNTAITNAVNALDVAEATANGITWKQTDGKVSISVSADTTPTDNSTKFVTSDGVHAAIAAAQAAATTKVQKASTTVTADVTSTNNTDGSKTYTIDTLSDVTLGTISGATTVEGNKINGTNVKYVDWSRVTSAANAFSGSKNTLTAFHADLDRLTNGNGMFNGCTKLTSFCGDLGSLTDGTNMFKDCVLDLESVIYIVDSLPTVSEGAITIGTTVVDSTDDIIVEARNKGWTVTID